MEVNTRWAETTFPNTHYVLSFALHRSLNNSYLHQPKLQISPSVSFIVLVFFSFFIVEWLVTIETH